MLAHKPSQLWWTEVSLHYRHTVRLGSSTKRGFFSEVLCKLVVVNVTIQVFITPIVERDIYHTYSGERDIYHTYSGERKRERKRERERESK